MIKEIIPHDESEESKINSFLEEARICPVCKHPSRIHPATEAGYYWGLWQEWLYFSCEKCKTKWKVRSR